MPAGAKPCGPAAGPPRPGTPVTGHATSDFHPHSVDILFSEGSIGNRAGTLSERTRVPAGLREWSLRDEKRYDGASNAAAAGMTGPRRAYRLDDLRGIDPLQVDRGHAQVRVTELALDHVERHALSCHLDRVRVSQLMGREAATNASLRSEDTKALADSPARPH